MLPSRWKYGSDFVWKAVLWSEGPLTTRFRGRDSGTLG
jgi:hypothetical protein